MRAATSAARPSAVVRLKVMAVQPPLPSGTAQVTSPVLAMVVLLVVSASNLAEPSFRVTSKAKVPAAKVPPVARPPA
ncbi:hypothetical protein DSECCO2_615160 [anaerobic digester metagenome]